jgi:hypothetical protein
LLALATLSAPAAGEPAHHAGLTLGLELGVGGGSFTVDSSEGSSTNQKAGVPAFGVLCGGFLGPATALALQVVGINYGPFDDARSFGVLLSAGPVIEQFATDRLSFTAGVGVGSSIYTWKGEPAGTFTRSGVSFAVGARYLPLLSAPHALGVGVDVIPILAGDHRFLIYQLSASWQLF